jgi:hypothetical protein
MSKRRRLTLRRGCSFRELCQEEANLTRKPTRVVRRVARAVVDQPFNSLGQAVETAEALRGSRDHQIADIVALIARRCRNKAHDLAVAAVEGKSDTNALRIVAGHLKPSDHQRRLD